MTSSSPLASFTSRSENVVVAQVEETDLLYEVLIEPRHGAICRPQDEPPHRYAVDFTLKKKLLHRPPLFAPAAERPLR